MKKYKLLYFVSEDEYFLSHKIDQAKSALKNKFEVLVVSNFKSYEKKIQSYGFKTQNLNFDRKSINPFKEMFCLLKFFFIVLNYKPNLIQSFALKPILYTSIISPFLKDKTKIILCVVGLGYMFIAKKFSARVLKNIYLTLINIFLKKGKTFFVFQNNDDKKIFEKNKITKNSKIFIIRGSGVDTNKFKKDNSLKIFDLIFHSRILYDKGFLEFIKAIKHLKKKMKISALVLGNPDPRNRSSIKYTQINKWKKENLIVWRKKKENVIPFLQQSKIAILPSYREGLPKTLLEAASCELPLIASDVVGCKEICLHNHNGLLVKPRDYISLSKAIKKILTNKKMAKKFGFNGRKLVEKNFSSKIVEKEFLKLYQDCLSK
ncbi:MAG: glycosyltransferase family 4 protein [Pseudomonadota bacterium]|nr:glycosyltransferase family 4 protein [Pseudomonadota bacterium]